MIALILSLSYAQTRAKRRSGILGLLAPESAPGLFLHFSHYL